MRQPILMILATLLCFAPLHAEEAPRVLKWAELRPPASADEAPKPKTFFSGAQPVNPAPGAADAAPPQQLAEGKFMSLKRRQPGGDKPPAVVAALNNQRVSIGGYIVPLDFEATTVKEFLLVPFVGACIHVPPPPANQIVYVKSEKGFEITGAGAFDPVTVSGVMKTSTAFTGLADAGYTIEAESVVSRTQ